MVMDGENVINSMVTCSLTNYHYVTERKTNNGKINAKIQDALK